jgi:hypothetical protein
MGYTTNPFNYTGTLPNQVQNDLQLANDNFNILVQAFVNNDPTTGTVKEADTVDGYHASQTPMPNTIPVADASGKLDADWLPTVSTRMEVVEFSSSATWTVPSNVSSILVVAVAGGGGGGGGGGGSNSGEGGYSGSSTVKAFSVSPGETITITIGAGGAGGYYGEDGGTGGDTKLTGSVTGSLLSVSGGIGGRRRFLSNSNGLPGMSSFFGRGGRGGDNGYNGEKAPSPGAGGGGGGGGDDWTSGGAGGGGFVRIIYFSS